MLVMGQFTGQENMLVMGKFTVSGQHVDNGSVYKGRTTYCNGLVYRAGEHVGNGSVYSGRTTCLYWVSLQGRRTYW